MSKEGADSESDAESKRACHNSATRLATPSSCFHLVKASELLITIPIPRGEQGSSETRTIDGSSSLQRLQSRCSVDTVATHRMMRTGDYSPESRQVDDVAGFHTRSLAAHSSCLHVRYCGQVASSMSHRTCSRRQFIDGGKTTATASLLH